MTPTTVVRQQDLVLGRVTASDDVRGDSGGMTDPEHVSVLPASDSISDDYKSVVIGNTRLLETVPGSGILPWHEHAYSRRDHTPEPARTAGPDQRDYWDSLSDAEINPTLAQAAELKRRLKSFEHDRLDAAAGNSLRLSLPAAPRDPPAYLHARRAARSDRSAGLVRSEAPGLGAPFAGR